MQPGRSCAAQPPSQLAQIARPRLTPPPPQALADELKMKGNELVARFRWVNSGVAFCLGLLPLPAFNRMPPEAHGESDLAPCLPASRLLPPVLPAI